MGDQKATLDREFGNLPPGASVFKLLRKGAGGKFTQCELASPGEDGVMLSRFPVSCARGEWIGTAFGPGVYKLQWWTEVGGQLKGKGVGPSFTIETGKKKKLKKKLVGPRSEFSGFLQAMKADREATKADFREMMGMQRETLEAQIARERIASEERIAQTNAYWGAMANVKTPQGAITQKELELQLKLVRLEGQQAQGRRVVVESPPDEDEEDEEDETPQGAILEGVERLNAIFGPDIMRSLAEAAIGMIKKKSPALAAAAEGVVG